MTRTQYGYKKSAPRLFRRISQALIRIGAALLLALLYIPSKLIDLFYIITRFVKSQGFWKGIAALLVLGILGAAAAAALWIQNLDVSRLSAPLPVPTIIYDQKGGKAVQLASSRMEPVPLSEIPQNMKNAVIAVEDKRFYDHKGIDAQAMIRALWRDIRSQGFAEGGSTITQQLAKNLFLPTDKTLSRKLKEAAYAIKIDTSVDKDEILETYLNSIYFGERQWGIQGAAKEYFGKNAADLSLEECALLAGLPKAPSVYSPFKDKDKALERRNLVLTLMKQQNMITEAEFARAYAAPIILRKQPIDDLNGKYPSFTDYVIQEAQELYGFTEEQITTGGLRIYTTLDPAVQQAAEEVYKDDRYFPEGKPDQPVQSGVAVIDHNDGGIRALVGQRGEAVPRGFNRATQLKRQPGSAFKPLSVYGPALERGYGPDTILWDQDLNINGYQPKDWDLQTRGYVTLQEAVVKSWNIPAVWLLHEIGIDAGMKFAQKAGIPLAKQDRQLGLALGGLTEGVSPLQMAQAYSIFPSLGTYMPAHAIVKIMTSDGSVLIKANPKPVKVMEKSTAYAMTGLLEQVVQSGTGQSAKLDRPTAGKTGTTELPETKEFAGISGSVAKDAWFVGYTPELTAAVWMGYDNTDKNHYLTTVPGVSQPGVVFKEIMKRALSGTPITPFLTP